MRNLASLQLRAHAVQRGHVWNANQYDVRDTLALGIRRCDSTGSVIRLHHLVLNGKVLPDEEESVRVVDLRHNVKDDSTARGCRQA